MMSVMFRSMGTALGALLLATVASAQELLPAVTFQNVAGVQYDMWPADVNGDGAADFVALGADDHLQVWLGRGDGTFDAPRVSSAYVRPLAVGDVNGDGRIDVIGGMLWEHTGRVDLVVLPGLGDGTFAEPVSITGASSLAFLVIADIDNDGHADLVGGYDGESGTLLVWPGHGDFTFDAAVSPEPGLEDPRAAAVVDLNGDGRREIVAAYNFYGVRVFTNTGGFTFTSAAAPSGSGRATGVKLADLNGDGAVDLVVTGRSSTFFQPPWTAGYVVVSLGDGHGGFAAGHEYPTGRGANSLVIGDFTRDGVLDVATLNHSYWITRGTNCFTDLYENGNSVSILQGRGDGTFRLPTTFAVEPQRGDLSYSYVGLRLHTITAADLNNDHYPDLLVGDGKILRPIAPRANRAPSAFAGADYRTSDYAEFLLDGTGTDPDGHFLDFQWSGGSGGTLLEGNQPLACYQEPTTAGFHHFTLTVSDGHGGVASDDLSIYLVHPPTVTLLAPTAGEVVPAGQPYTIRWTATSEDPLEAFYVYGLRDGGGVPFTVEGCTNLPGTARSCTWTNVGPPTADARIYVEVSDTGHQIGSDHSGSFVIAALGAPLPSGWQHGDVGAVGAAGRASFSNSVFQVTGSGADIWGTADEFHYAYTTASRNFEIIARVASVQNIDQWTKAGVMIRESLAAGARHASLFMTPTTVKGIAFQRRPVAGGASVHTAGPARTPPGWLRLARNGTTIAAYTRLSTDEPWQLIGVQSFASLADTLLVGLAVSSHVDGRVATATFDHVSVATDQFQSADIGSVGVTGATSLGSSGLTVRGSGADIWGTADAFRYYYRPWTGDGSITVRVASIENTHPWAKAGVMFRETLAANSRHVMAIVSAGKGVAMQYRTTSGGPSASGAVAAGAAPGWLRLTRTGNVFTAAASADGTTWHTLGSVTMAMPATIVVGLPVTSHNNAALAAGVFDNPILTW